MAEIPDAGVLTTQSDADRPVQGPVERFMNPLVHKGIDTLVPEQYRDKLKTGYDKNPMLYNLGLIGLLGLGGAAVAGGVKHAFNSDDDFDFDPSAGKWRRRTGFARGMNNALSFLAPMALLAGGVYLWNKHGDKLMGKLKDLKAAAADAEKWKNREANVRRKIGKVPGGNWAVTQLEKFMDN